MSSKTKDKIPSRCEICGVERGKKKFIAHHFVYPEDDTEIITYVCQPCHCWLHGRRVFGHMLLPRKVKHKSEKGLAMVNFALRVLQAFLRKKKWVLIIDKEGLKFFTYKFLKVLENEVLKAEEVNEVDRILNVTDGEETSH
jgi:hypothetical protein